MVPTKSRLRNIAREKRAGLAAARPDFARALAGHAEALKIAPHAIVGGYCAHGDEADPGLLLARLAGQGAVVAFPRVAAKDAPLEFHLRPAGEAWQPGAFGIPEPLAHWPRATPSVLLVPLLAFDAEGYRLGYGGGYYDRTLATQKARAIGIAFAGQLVDALPREVHDCRLDAILTEQGLKRFA